MVLSLDESAEQTGRVAEMHSGRGADGDVETRSENVVQASGEMGWGVARKLTGRRIRFEHRQKQNAYRQKQRTRKNMRRALKCHTVVTEGSRQRMMQKTRYHESLSCIRVDDVSTQPAG